MPPPWSRASAPWRHRQAPTWPPPRPEPDLRCAGRHGRNGPPRAPPPPPPGPRRPQPPHAREEAALGEVFAVTAAARAAPPPRTSRPSPRALSETIAPRPTPGKDERVVALADAEGPTAASSTGSNGLPVATSARPSVHCRTSLGMRLRLAGGVRHRKHDRSLDVPSPSRGSISSVNVPGSPEVPMRTVGLITRTTARRSRGWFGPRPMPAAKRRARRTPLVLIDDGRRPPRARGCRGWRWRSRAPLPDRPAAWSVGAQETRDADARGSRAQDHDALLHQRHARRPALPP